MASLTIDALLELWLADLRANDLTPGTVRRYKSAIESFLAWYEQEEQRSFALELLSPITLIGYRNILQCTQQRATSTVNGHISALRAWCAWLTVERFLETNPAKHIRLVGRQEASSREGAVSHPGHRPPPPGAVFSRCRAELRHRAGFPADRDAPG